MTRAVAITTALLTALTGCNAGSRAPEPERRRSWSVPAADVGERCSDVARGRVCWSPQCAGGICRVRRELPSAPATTPSGFRCQGSGGRRVCVDRALGAGPFACAEGTCVQREPRLPDDGEWTCHETAGAVVCREIEAVPVVAPGAVDAAFVCGETAKGRVCVDFSPDLPDAARDWRCRFEHEPRLRRVCRPGADPGALGSPCDARRPCVDGARCSSGHCAPERPEPACLLDADCPSGACRFGSCRGGGA